MSDRLSQPFAIEAYPGADPDLSRQLESIQRNFESLFQQNVASATFLVTDLNDYLATLGAGFLTNVGPGTLTIVATPLPVGSGGTGLGSFTVGAVLYASAATTIAGLAIGAAGTVIRSTGTLPAYSTFTVPDTFAQGDLIYGSATNVLTALAKNTSSTRYLSNTGSSNSPAWAQVALTTGVSGVLPEANGGTNQSTYTTGDILYASASNTLSKLAGVATGNALISGGVSTAPSWGKIALTTHISGILPVANGGTNSSTALSGSSIVISNGSALIQGAAGSTTTVLHGNASGAPTYSAVSLTADITGTLAVGSGGTGITSYAVGDILYASTTSVLSKLADVSAGSFLRSGGANTAPSWSDTKWPASLATGDIIYANTTNSAVALTIGSSSTVLVGGTTPSWSGTPTLTSLLVGNGSASSPSLASSADTNTGLYWNGSDLLGFTTGGTSGFVLTSTGQFVIGATSANARAYVSIQGAVSGNFPRALEIQTTITATGNNDMAGYISAPTFSSNSSLTINNAASMYINAPAAGTLNSTPSVAASLYIVGAPTLGTVNYAINAPSGNSYISVVWADSGTAGAPGLSFVSDPDTGLYRITTNVLGFATSGTEKARLDSNGNFGVDTTVFGTSAAGVIGIGNGTVPSSSPADMIQLYSVDISAGNASLGLRTETTVQSAATVSDSYLNIKVNGTTYKLLLST